MGLPHDSGRRAGGRHRGRSCWPTRATRKRWRSSGARGPFIVTARCEDVRTYEVDNDARKRALERLLGPPRREDEEGSAQEDHPECPST
jgi:hypothetical protein